MLKAVIGETAGQVYKVLGANNSKVTLNDLTAKVRADTNIVQQAIGWLAREGKIELTQQGKRTYISLTPNELNNYQQAQL